MEGRQSPGLGLQLDGSRSPAAGDCGHLRRQRNVVVLQYPKALVGVRARSPDSHRTDSMSRAPVDAAALPHNVVLIRGKIGERFDESTRPANYDLLRLGGLAQAEMQAQVALRYVAVPTAYFHLVFIAALSQGHHRAQSGAIRFDTDKLQADPILSRRRVVVERRFLVHVVHQRLLVSVVE